MDGRTEEETSSDAVTGHHGTPVKIRRLVAMTEEVTVGDVKCYTGPELN